MRTTQKNVLAILAATVWINLSEFVRNQFMLLAHWEKHYADKGLVFPAEPVNGAMWGIWGTLFAIYIFIISRRFSLVQTVALCWVAGFVFMWLVIGNLGVLPFSILPYAIPLSIIEVLGAAWIVKKMAAK